MTYAPILNAKVVDALPEVNESELSSSHKKFGKTDLSEKVNRPI